MMRTNACSAAARAVILAVMLAPLALAGCLPASTSGGDASPGNDTSTTTDTGGAVTYTKDVQPIFLVKCAPCHTTDGQGAHNIGTTYADALKPVMDLDAPSGCFKNGDTTMPKTIGECTLPAIMEGWMPMAMGCFNTPRPAPCVTLAEQDIVAAWIAAGMPQ